MPSKAKLDSVRALIGASPDKALTSLAMALNGAGGDLTVVADMIAHEQTARRLSGVVPAPGPPARRYPDRQRRLHAHARR